MFLFEKKQPMDRYKMAQVMEMLFDMQTLKDGLRDIAHEECRKCSPIAKKTLVLVQPDYRHILESQRTVENFNFFPAEENEKPRGSSKDK